MLPGHVHAVSRRRRRGAQLSERLGRRDRRKLHGNDDARRGRSLEVQRNKLSSRQMTVVLGARREVGGIVAVELSLQLTSDNLVASKLCCNIHHSHVLQLDNGRGGFVQRPIKSVNFTSAACQKPQSGGGVVGGPLGFNTLKINQMAELEL